MKRTDPKYRILIPLVYSALLVPALALSQESPTAPSVIEEQSSEECTIGAASGRATKDGRPMIWKTRDTGSFDNAVAWITSSPIPYLAVVDGGSRTSSWMSLNARGFAIINSVAYDLTAGSTGMGNGTLMAFASGRCATVAAFQHILDSTNITGRTTYANFVVMDSTGAAAIYETSGNAYWKFDATDAVAYPKGYILRTNFTSTGGGSTGIERFNRTTTLFQSFSAGDSITPKSILRHQMRDFADPSGVPYPIPFNGSINGAPYGYIPASLTICRTISASAAVMQGIRPGENANMSTFWVMLGCPATSLTVPYWPVGPPPAISTDAPSSALNDAANAIKARIVGGTGWTTYMKSQLLRNSDGSGLLSQHFAAEDLIMMSADSILARWRSGQCSVSDLLAAEANYAGMALAAMSSSLAVLKTVPVEASEEVPDGYVLEQNYPNPFNSNTGIRYHIPVISNQSSVVSVKVYDLLGREVAVLVNAEKMPGTFIATWNAEGMASGIYIYVLRAGAFRETRRMILLK